MFDDKRILNRLSWSIYPKHHIKGIETRKPSFFIDEYNRHTWQIHCLISKILDLIMARPNKTGLDYFPLDIDFFDDEKIIAISGEFGIKGEIVAIKLLCAIYRNGYFILWNDLLKFKLLKNLPGISSELLDSIMNRLVLWGFFDKGLFDSMGVLTSVGIQKRYFKISKRRKSVDDFRYLLVEVCGCENKEVFSSDDGDVSSDTVNVYNNGVNVCNNPFTADINVCKNTTKKRKGNNKEISLSRDKEKFPPPEVVDKTLSECYDELSCDRSWIEIVTMNTRNFGHKDFTIDMFGMYLKRFFEKLQNEGEERKSPKDAKSHFARWLNIELNKKANYESKPITNNIYEQKRIDSERRKSRLMAEFAEADAKFLAEQEAKRKAVGSTGEIPNTIPDGG